MQLCVAHLIGSLPAFNLALSRFERNVDFSALGTDDFVLAYLLLIWRHGKRPCMLISRSSLVSFLELHFELIISISLLVEGDAH
jgi:hypothetical protein